MSRRHRLPAGVLCVTLAILLIGSARSAAEGPPPVFATWDVFEPDKCASIWLIKRFIDPRAEIVLYPKGEIIKKGIPFDTPEAKFRRYYNASTYETLLRHYEIDDPLLIHIGRIIHDVEINTWERKRMPESRQLMEAISRILAGSDTGEEIIAGSLDYMDRFHAALKKQMDIAPSE